MKIWNGYGSEHSMNLVMVGHFKTEDDAQKTQEIIDKLTAELSGRIDFGTCREYFETDVSDILRETDCYVLSPSELEQFLYDTETRVSDDKIILRTDETEVSAFFKLMVHKGAKVEIYSAHDYPDEEHSS